jgi:two-component system chemotaxis response regulator CheY
MRFNRILVVDDSATSRLIVKRCFEIAGFSDATFVESPDGAAALDLLRTSRFDLVVTDLRMPRVDGVTLVRKMRASSFAASIPVVVISSVARASDKEATLGDSVLAVVQKPLSPAKLMHALKTE